MQDLFFKLFVRSLKKMDIELSDSVKSVRRRDIARLLYR